MQVVFGRVGKSASAPASPCVSRSSTPGPPSDVDFDNYDDERDDDDDDDAAEADSEEEREELSKRETPTRQLTAALSDIQTNPAGDHILPA